MSLKRVIQYTGAIRPRPYPETAEYVRRASQIGIKLEPMGSPGTTSHLFFTDRFRFWGSRRPTAPDRRPTELRSTAPYWIDRSPFNTYGCTPLRPHGAWRCLGGSFQFEFWPGPEHANLNHVDLYYLHQDMTETFGFRRTSDAMTVG